VGGGCGRRCRVGVGERPPRLLGVGCHGCERHHGEPCPLSPSHGRGDRQGAPSPLGLGHLRPHTPPPPRPAPIAERAASTLLLPHRPGGGSTPAGAAPIKSCPRG